MPHRRTLSPVLLLVGAALAGLPLAGCSDNYRLRYDMPPQNLVDVRLAGGGFAIVENDGPGVIDVSFDAEGGEAASPMSPGTARGRTVDGEQLIRITTGDEKSRVRLDADSMSGVTSHGPLPR